MGVLDDNPVAKRYPDTAKSKMDLLGSSLTISYANGLEHRATRRGRVVGLAGAPYTDSTNPNANTDLIDAIRKAEDTNLGPHPQGGMPLNRTRAYKYGNTRAWVAMEYKWNRWSLDPPPVAAFDRAKLQMAYERVPVFRTLEPRAGFDVVDHGIPNGQWYTEIDELDREKRPLAYMWRRPVVKIAVSTTLSYHPFNGTGGGATLFALQGKVNSAGVTFGGYVFQKYTVRYDGTSVDWSWSGSGGASVYPTVHTFTACRSGWYTQYLTWEDTPPLIGNWGTATALAYEDDTFVNAFPVNDP